MKIIKKPSKVEQFAAFASPGARERATRLRATRLRATRLKGVMLIKLRRNSCFT